MKRGKQTCRILKEIRQQIAEANDIEFITSECHYQGDCLGNCPKCEAEVRYLEQQLAYRKTLGKTIVVLGLSAGVITMNGQPLVKTPNKQEICQDSLTKKIDKDKFLLVKGRVYAADNKSPITGASITKKGTNLGTISDLNGYFSFKIFDTNFILQVSLIGMETKYIEVDKNNARNLKIQLKTDDSFMPGEVLTIEDIINPKDTAKTIPNFPGGIEAMEKFIEENLKSPVPEKHITGDIIVQFDIGKRGKISNVKVVRGIAPEFDREALRVVRLMPRWEPSTLGGKAVKTKYTIPVTFKQEKQKQ